MQKQELLSIVDHTLLSKEATEDDIKVLCSDAKKWAVKSVCIYSEYLPIARRELAGSQVLLCTVANFPNGAASISDSKQEVIDAIRLGADEIDIVLPQQSIQDKDYMYIEDFLRTMRSAAKNKILKLILESATLNDGQIIAVCKIAKKSSFDFVKTSTGFNSAGGASEHAVALMRKTVGNTMGVKASGGIRTLAKARAMIEAGANRLGLSATGSITAELDAHFNGM